MEPSRSPLRGIPAGILLFTCAALPAEALAGARVVRSRLAEARARSTRTTTDEAPPPVARAAVVTTPGEAIARAGTSEANAPSASAGIPSASADIPSVELGVRSGLIRRSLDFTQDIYGRMRALRASLYVYRIDAAVYPAFRAPGLTGRLGLIARYERSFGGTVRDADFGADFQAYHSELVGGLRLRQPVRDHLLGFELTAARSSSGLNDERGAAGTPDVRYTEARGGIDGTLRFERVRLTASTAFRVPLGYGEIGEREWFPRVGGYGLDASATFSYSLTPFMSANVGASMRRFVLEMNSEPEDGTEGISEIAGGAVDLYAGAYIGLSFLL